ESEVESLNGYVGNFTVRIRRRGESQPREESVGAIVVATGFELYPMERLPEYGAGTVPDVISGLEMEMLLRPDGPTGGRILRPSDGRPPKEVVFVQCAGSRDPEHAMPYCSKICCMYTAKQARLFRRQCPDGQAYVFYIDIRTGGKGAEEFAQAAMEEERVLYLRGKVSKIFRDGDKVIVWGADTLSSQQVEIAADMVVLATAIVPRPETRRLAEMLGIDVDAHGFLQETNPNLEPVSTRRPGVFIAGTAVGPRDIPETVAQASAAAAKVLSLFAHWQAVPEVTHAGES
ncbi:MAG: hypothetical protein ACP5TV_13800, partial [Anaerolineae bacterium]